MLLEWTERKVYLQSQSANTIQGFFPPSSRVTLFRLLLAAASWISWPTCDTQTDVNASQMMQLKKKIFRLHIFNKKMKQQQIILLKSFLVFWIKTLLKNCLMLMVLQYPPLVRGHYHFLKDEIWERWWSQLSFIILSLEDKKKIINSQDNSFWSLGNKINSRVISG